MWAIVKLFFSGPFDRIMGSVDHVVSNDTQREKIRADVIERYAAIAAEERADARRYRAFWWVWSVIAGSAAVWFALITLDTIGNFSWSVADYPPSVKHYVDTIFASVFGSGGVVAAAQAISSAIRGRR